MKKILLIFLFLSTITAFSSNLRNGIYRGVFVSGQETQVEVQFNLKNDIVRKPRYRTLSYKKKDYLKDTSVADQKTRYEIILKYIEGKNIKNVLEKLYKSSEIEMAGASIRGSKIRASMQNAINSGVYKPE